jgi:hypothetical protein
VLSTSADATVLSTQCATLGACCSTLPSEVTKSCGELAAQASATECATELSALSAAGRCLGDAGTGEDATVHSEGGGASDGGDGGSAVACVLLQACCTSSALPSGEVATCQSIQGEGDEGQCSTLFSDLAASSECGVATYGSGGACSELGQCCTSPDMPNNFLSVCNGAVETGDNANCEQLLGSLVPAGYCGGTVAQADGGPAIDSDCATLSQCCQEITFPAGALSTCKHIASANQGGDCLSAYDSYVALNYCADTSN